MRFPFLNSLRSKSSAPPERPERPERKRGAAAAASDDDATLTAARTRARRRLVGALVLLLVGVGVFPILFDTQPRPLPMDTPIEMPARAGTLRGDASPPRPKPVLPARDAETDEIVRAAPPAVAPSPQPPSPQPPSQTVAAAPKPVTADTAPPPPAAAPKPAPTPAAASATAPAPAAPGRFVVQVGAYTDATMLREARAKVERLGLKTYTQVIDNAAGKRTRVRLGPFATRDEADAAAAKVKRAGMPADILVL